MDKGTMPSWRLDSIRACVRELRDEAAAVEGPAGVGLRSKIDNLEGKRPARQDAGLRWHDRLVTGTRPPGVGLRQKAQKACPWPAQLFRSR